MYTPTLASFISSPTHLTTNKKMGILMRTQEEKRQSKLTDTQSVKEKRSESGLMARPGQSRMG